jgi:hypothetical protein
MSFLVQKGGVERGKKADYEEAVGEKSEGDTAWTFCDLISPYIKHRLSF